MAASVRRVGERSDESEPRVCRSRRLVIPSQQRRRSSQTAGMFHRDDRRCVAQQCPPHMHPAPSQSTFFLAGHLPPSCSELTGQLRQMARSCSAAKTQQVLCCQRPLRTSTLSLSRTPVPTSTPPPSRRGPASLGWRGKGESPESALLSACSSFEVS